ncbi:RNA methyltransferase [Tissierella creatinini]|nr:RNA methyltransferase [Tissierella creatinini]TJX63219.1 RNA methyltransferase [Soehngenia saccharolytica]
MMEISSSKNPLVKEIKSLLKKKYRWEKGLFIIEGIKLVEEALDNDVHIKNILYTDKLITYTDGINLLEKLKNFKSCFRVSESLFNEITNMENSQGIIGVAYFQIRNLDINRGNRFLLFLDGIQDPGNMGTIIRSADAFNIDGIIIGEGSVDAYNPKVVRSTMGSIFRVPLYFTKDNMESLELLKSKGFKIYSTSLEGSVANYDIEYKDDFIIVIGSESQGVNRNILDISDKRIKIPMPGSAESLNAGVAASIIMYEGMKQRGKILSFTTSNAIID